MRSGFLLLVGMIFSISSSTNYGQSEHQHASSETLGSVAFTTSCSTEVQPQFNRAVALMHSFEFSDAIEGFNALLAKDPSCTLAYWGIALSSWGNPFATGMKSPAQLQRGLDAVIHGRAVPPKTKRERDYIEAVSHLFSDAAKLDQHTRAVAYENAMATVSASYPDDTEAAIFYALALAGAADPADKSYARQLKAGAMLEALFIKYPNHPGLAHYIIHAYDVPPLADRAVGAARRYSEIAPSSPHALHMPSHTFTRIGDWQASIEANIASACAAKSASQPAEELHAMDYLVYAYLQTGQDSAAKRLVDSSATVFASYDPASTTKGAATPSAAYFARAAIPARYALERGSWADAAKLEPVSSPYPYTDAITYFARGLGSAHGKDRAATQLAIGSLAQLHDKLVPMKEEYWAYQVEIQRMEVSAWLAYAEGDSQGALVKMRAAVDAEDKTEKSAVTPGPLAPAREQLGELFLELKRPSEALKEFEATLTKEPNRLRALCGASKAAELAGNHATAVVYARKALKVAEHADSPERRELAELRVAARSE
jgi:hypothetical protein